MKNALRWRHNDHDGGSNHQPHGCLLNRLFRRKSKKTSKLRVTGLCVGNSPGPVNSPHKGPVTRKMFPFDDVIMEITVEVWEWISNFTPHLNGDVIKCPCWYSSWNLLVMGTRAPRQNKTKSVTWHLYYSWGVSYSVTHNQIFQLTSNENRTECHIVFIFRSWNTRRTTENIGKYQFITVTS